MSVFDAAAAGDLDALRAADLEARQPPYAWTLLHVAAANGRLSAVDLLLERGADVHAREFGDNTCAIHWAAAHGHVDVVARLADAGADVIGAGDDHALEVIGWATCFGACHEDVARLLLERGARQHVFSAIALNDGEALRGIVAADPSALNRRMSRNEDHQLPLHFAARQGRREMVALLIELGADPLGIDAWGHDVAAYATAPDVDRTALDAVRAMAVRRQPIAALAAGEAAEPAPGVLHLLAKRNDVEAVRRLLARGADPNALWSHWGAEVTPLHLAAAQGHTEMLRVLLDAGADATVRDSLHDGDALGWAHHFGQAQAVAVLDTAPPEGSVVLEFREHDEHLREILGLFENGWVVGITTRAGLVRLELETPGETWGASVSLVEDRLDRLPFDWRSHACCLRP